MIYRATNEKVPYFNAPVFLESKTPVGKVDEIFGPTTEMVRVAACWRATVHSPRARGSPSPRTPSTPAPHCRCSP